MRPPESGDHWDICDTLLRSVTHDLANPLTVIGSYVTLLLEQRIPEADQDLILRRMKDNVDQALRKMGEVRNLVQQKRRLAGISSEPLRLRPLLEGALRAEAQAFGQKGISLISPRWSGEEILVLGEQDRLTQHVLRPVLNNALKFSSPGSAVTVGIDIQAHEALVHIDDQGVGISSERLQRQHLLPTAGTAGDLGSGFSLLLAQHLLQLLEGRLLLESKKDLGTRVTIALKRALL